MRNNRQKSESSGQVLRLKQQHLLSLNSSIIYTDKDSCRSSKMPASNDTISTTFTHHIKQLYQPQQHPSILAISNVNQQTSSSQFATSGHNNLHRRQKNLHDISMSSLQTVCSSSSPPPPPPESMIDSLDFFCKSQSGQIQSTPISKFLKIHHQPKESFHMENSQKNGMSVIQFPHSRTLIQPNFLEDKGTMCITELWPEKMKQELVRSHLAFNEHVLHSKEMAMSRIDKEFTQRYKPKMMSDHLLAMKSVRDFKQNVQVSHMGADHVIGNYGLKAHNHNAKQALLRNKHHHNHNHNHNANDSIGLTANTSSFSKHKRNFSMFEGININNNNSKLSSQQSTNSTNEESNEQDDKLEGDNTNDGYNQECHKENEDNNREIDEQDGEEEDGETVFVNSDESIVEIPKKKKKMMMKAKENMLSQIIEYPQADSPCSNNSNTKLSKQQFSSQLSKNLQTTSSPKSFSSNSYYQVSSSLRKKNKDINSSQISALNGIKDSCENVLEETLHLDYDIERFEVDFNEKINGIDKHVSKMVNF